MLDDSTDAKQHDSMLLLGIDTCGPTGSVALGRLAGESVEILGQTELEGRTYAATLISSVADLLQKHGIRLRDLGSIVVVNGPGSFTGVRVGLSAAKGLAEGAGIPLLAVSRLEVLAFKAGIESAALDAHRHEVFLRIPGGELLAGAADLAEVSPPPAIAVCDEAAAELVAASWPAAALHKVDAPTAGDALRRAVPRIRAGQSDDVALLDGHYLRRSDAEIFGNPIAAAVQPS